MRGDFFKGRDLPPINSMASRSQCGHMYVRGKGPQCSGPIPHLKRGSSHSLACSASYKAHKPISTPLRGQTQCSYRAQCSFPQVWRSLQEKGCRMTAEKVPSAGRANFGPRSIYPSLSPGPFSPLSEMGSVGGEQNPSGF